MGKSTTIDALGTRLTNEGHKVAVLAVDPSSARTGGSILADKTRMARLSADPNAFVRPSPSSGTLGGVAAKTRESMLICEAAGYDVVLVETIGTGQSETAVADMTDFFLVLMLPGAGDELQGLKKGVVELADMIAVNKADGDNVKRAKAAAAEYRAALHILTPRSPDWTPPVVTYSALTGEGIAQLWTTVLDHRARVSKSGELAARRREQQVKWMWAMLEDRVFGRLNRTPRSRPSCPSSRPRSPKARCHRPWRSMRSPRRWGYEAGHDYQAPGTVLGSTFDIGIAASITILAASGSASRSRLVSICHCAAKARSYGHSGGSRPDPSNSRSASRQPSSSAVRGAICGMCSGGQARHAEPPAADGARRMAHDSAISGSSARSACGTTSET